MERELDSKSEEVRRSEERFRSIVAATTDWIWEMDLDGKHTYSSDGLETILGYHPAEMSDMDIFELFHPDDRRVVQERLPQLMQGKSGWRNWLLRFRHKDGRYRYLESSAVPVLNRAGELIGYRGADRDVTQRHQAEEELARQRAALAHVSRLNTMGEMAAGIAHELNQPLTAIASYAFAGKQILDEAGDLLPEAENLREILEKLSTQALRGGSIVRSLREFVKKRAGDHAQRDLNQLVRDVVELGKPEIRMNEVDLALELDEAIPLVRIDEIQIQQVVLNLVRNAIDAMVETESDRRNIVIVTSVPAEDRVQVSVRDSGSGLSAQERDRVFEAFYTTKKEGVGMGLAISRSIVERHGGQMWAEAESGPGEIFRFTLPIPQSGRRV